jgi:hypothetical protein
MRSMRMAALAVAMTVMFSGLALAHDDYKDKHKHDHDHWYKHDDHHDHDLWRHEKHERVREEREHHWWEREHRNDGYYGGGEVYNRYPRTYPNGGYGYPSGGYGYPGSVYGRSGGGRNEGFNIGLQDGSYRAREDMSQNKPFNPNPRGSFGNRDHGYNSSFGDKTFYRAEYTRGYEQGYQSNYRGGRGRGWGF